MLNFKSYPYGFFTIGDYFGGIPRLTVCCHGGLYDIEANAGYIHLPAFSGQKLAANDLLDLLFLQENVLKFGYVRLVICHSATGGVASVAAHLSALLPGIQIEGFIGIVYSAGLELYESSLRIGGLDLYNDDRLLGSFDSDFVYEKYYSSALHRTVIDDFFSKTARRCTLFDPIIAEDSGDSVLFINGKVVSIDV